MSTRCFKIDWLIPLAGIALVAVSLVGAATYLGLEREIRAKETFGVTLDRLFQDQTVCAALKTIRDGEVDLAARQLDLRLCDDILQTNAELAGADARTREYVTDAFRRIALMRPKLGSGETGGPAQACSEDQKAAERILELALAGGQRVQKQ